MSSTKATYLLQQENKTNNECLSSAVLHSDLIKLSLTMSNNILKPELLTTLSCLINLMSIIFFYDNLRQQV